MELCMSLLNTLRFSLTGLLVGALALTGCSDASESHADHADHDHAEHADHDHAEHAEHAADTHDTHAGHDHGDEATEHVDENVVRTDLYEGVLGELIFIPEAGDMKRHPKIHHVQIPDFKKIDGTVSMTPDGIPGMRSMTMEFPLAQGVSLDGYSVGDKVKFSFRVNWGGQVAWEMTSIEKLDPTTEIDYSNVKAEP
jgi:Copper binding periplasmic protein CusF